MEKTRVPKGEEYWYISIGLEGVNVFSAIDFRDGYTNLRFRQGNYFHTKEEAEACACKLRAVLKGADVIETPSEEEFRQEAKKQKRNHIPIPDEEDYKKGFWDAVWVIKSKIVK